MLVRNITMAVYVIRCAFKHCLWMIQIQVSTHASRVDACPARFLYLYKDLSYRYKYSVYMPCNGFAGEELTESGGRFKVIITVGACRIT